MIGPFHVDVPIFRMSVAVCCGCSSQDAVDVFYDYKGKKSRLANDARESSSTGWVQAHGGDVFMWVENPKDAASTVFHELVHVAFSICQSRGMQYDEELLAYLVGWLKIEVADRIFNEAETPTQEKEI